VDFERVLLRRLTPHRWSAINRSKPAGMRRTYARVTKEKLLCSCKTGKWTVLCRYIASVRRWEGPRKELDLFLFPGYVFVHMSLRNRLRVLDLPGVVRFLSCNGHPVPVPTRRKWRH
jgi:transcription antitermination factor NusG